MVRRIAHARRAAIRPVAAFHAIARHRIAVEPRTVAVVFADGATTANAARVRVGAPALLVLVAFEANAERRIAMLGAIDVRAAAMLAAAARRIAPFIDGAIEVEPALDAAVGGAVTTSQAQGFTMYVVQTLDAGSGRRIAVQ